ncbi:MAG: Glycosyl transferase, group 2 family [Nitrospira sp.]|nr:MAG: Glycosyl transferase, group 2 family [Nitrospira sp.]
MSMPKRVVKVFRFARFSLAEGLAWYRRHGRPPKRSEVFALFRKAFSRFKILSQRNAPVPKTIEPVFSPYDAWLRVNVWNQRRRDDLLDRLSRHAGQLPTISLVMPVHDPPLEWLTRAIESVRAQVCGEWELCIADDCSTNPAVRAELELWRTIDSRIHVTYLQQNVNISEATNSAVMLATGEFLLFLDHDDELTPDAVGEVLLYLAEHSDTDVLYSDDDKIDLSGRRYAPQFKPDWSPELLLSYMYLSHVFVVRRALFHTVGAMRTGFEGAQDYDLALRLAERTIAVGHIPKVLYHWRALPGSTATNGAAKPAGLDAGRRAIAEAFERRGIVARVIQPEFASAGKLGIYAHEFPDDGPSVTILIPTKNQAPILRQCIESLGKTTYRNYEIVIIDNESDESDTLTYLRSLPHRVLRIGTPSGRFNFSTINNRAVEQVSGEFVLFLNNDTEVKAPRWLSQMIGYAQMPGVGAVGAKLMFADGRIQHAGVIHGLYHGLAGPAFKLTPAWEHGYLAYASVVRNYSAVTAACLLTSRRRFLELGGFNEDEFGVAYNDVDYCYRLVEQGYRCVYCPDAQLNHYEGYSRGFCDDPAEIAAFKQTYRNRKDPWYSPHLSLTDEQFNLIPRTIAVRRQKPIPIAMTALSLNYEGAPWSQYELTKELVKRNVIQPIVFSPVDGPLRALYEEQGIAVMVDRHPLWGVTNLSEYEAAIQAFSRKCLSWGAELVYANTLQSFYAVAAARKAGLPSVWNPRESEPWQTYFDYLPDGVIQKAYDCFAWPYRVVFVADATRDAYTALNTRHNFTVIRNGLDCTRIEQACREWSKSKARTLLGVQGDEVVVLLLGTVCSRKGQQDLVNALSRLPADCQERVCCYIVGDRPSEYSKALHALTKELPSTLRDRVHIVPETRQTTPYYRAADLFVCTSKLESYPRVVLEAMAYGLPIVTTPVFGIREQVREGVNALLYEPGDIGALASQLCSLLRDEGFRSRMGANSVSVLAIGTNFEEMVESYAEVFTEAWLSGGGPAA